MRQHVTVLGVLFIALGALGILVGLAALLVLGGSAGIVSVAAQEQPEARLAVPILGLLAVGACLLFVLVSVPGIVAGVGLVRFRPWARVLGLVLAALSLFNIPIGTAVGAYGLWVLLSPETEELFRGGERPDPQAPDPSPEPPGG